MNDLLHSLGDTFHNPSRFHAAVVHLPVAIGVIGVIFVVALALTRGRSSTLRTVALVLYLVGAFSGFVAYRSGEAAQEHATESVALTDEADATFEHHEDMGKSAWMFLAGTMLAVGLTAINRPALRVAFVALALAASLTTAGWIVVTAHYGGALVYQHGVGVPATPNNIRLMPSAEDARQSFADFEKRLAAAETEEKQRDVTDGLLNYLTRFQVVDRTGPHAVWGISAIDQSGKESMSRLDVAQWPVTAKVMLRMESEKPQIELTFKPKSAQILESMMRDE